MLESHGDESVRNEIYTLEPSKEIKPTDLLKEPYILEFLNLEDSHNYHEKEMEQAIIDHMQHFLMELGRGFSFVARQQRLTIGRKNFYIDLVFYNYLLKCFVLIDLKVGEITHQDLGQIQMYVNYYTRKLMSEGDNKPIGIILGAEKDNTVVEYALPDGNTQIFTSKYKLYIPTKEELKRELSLKKFNDILPLSSGVDQDAVDQLFPNNFGNNLLTRESALPTIEEIEAQLNRSFSSEKFESQD